MVNPDFQPTDNEEAVIDVMEEENKANPLRIREQTGLGKGDINTALTRLTSAGWVRKITRGLYEFVDDPRTESTEQTASHSESGPEYTTPSGGVEEALEGWKPGQGGEDTRMRREVGQQVLRWLEEHDGGARKSAFVDALYEETHLSGQNSDSWWETTARAALQYAAESGYVDDSGKKYRWSQ